MQVCGLVQVFLIASDSILDKRGDVHGVSLMFDQLANVNKNIHNCNNKVAGAFQVY